MAKQSSMLCTLFMLLAACEPVGGSNVLVVRGEVSALLSGDGMPADERQKAFGHDEMWLDVDPEGRLWGFEAQPWDLEAGQHTYDLSLEFDPPDSAGRTTLRAARVCFVTCGEHYERDGCAGPCFDRLQSGTVDIVDISDDGKSFDLRFALEVADVGGRTVRVADGKARTRD